MSKLKAVFGVMNKKTNRIFVTMGLLFSVVAYLPNLILQKGSVFRYQDQLDGEIFTYIFGAKYLGQNVDKYLEMFNGINQNGLVMPAPFFVILYKFFDPFTALLLMHIMISCLAFFGMYLVIEKCLKSKPVAFLVGLVFAYLPFFGVYGMSIMGIPLLIYAFLNLIENEKRGLSYFIILLYAVTSSLSLVGFAILINLFIVFIALLLKKERRKAFNVGVGGIILAITYLLLNISLVKQILSISSDSMVSHKEEIYVYAIPFLTSFKEFFMNGSFHMQSYQLLIVIVSIFTIVFGVFRRNKDLEKGRKLFCVVLLLFSYNFVVGILCSIFSMESVVNFRNRVGGVIKYFQLNRISWVTPFVWYFIFAVVILYWVEYIRLKENEKIKKYIAMCFLTVVIMGISVNVLYNSTFKVNIRQMVNPKTSNSITWNKFYNEELFEEIKEYIGEPQSEYRVVSLGISPAMALYSGFYCLDGYSNNYDLDYKEKFRVIMEKELDKNEALRMYYDNWGNRCYLLSDELGQNFFCQKGNEIVINDLELNTKQIYEMGGRYLFSGVQIRNLEENNLQFEKYFEREDSLVGIYLYKIIE